MSHVLRAAAFLISIIIYTSHGYAAVADSLLQRYAGEYGVMSEYTEHLTLEFDKSGQLTARGTTTKDILITNDKYNQFFNTGTVYHSYFNELKSLEAATLVPSGKGYKTIKSVQKRTVPSPSESVFYDDARETEVTFTNLGKGAITHLESETNYRDIRLLPRFYFQNYLPMATVTFKVTYPKDVHIESVIKGTEQSGFIKKTIEENKKTTTVTWTASHVPKAKTYSDAPAINSYLPHIVIYVKDYKHPTTCKQIEVFGTVAELNNFCNSFVKDLKPAPATPVKEMAATITKDANSPREKAAAIYKWLQQNVRYVAYEDSLGGFVPREPEVVLHRRFGDCKDMAALLRALCRSVGLEAHYVWIGTRKIPYKYEDTPLPIVFNHMIAAVKIDGDWVFMDGTDPVIPFGAVPYAIQGKEGLIGKAGDSYEVVTMPVSAAAQNTLNDTSFIAIEGSGITGNAAITMNGFAAWDMATVLKYQVERDRKKLFDALTQRGSNKYAQKSFDYIAKDTADKSLRVQAAFEVKDYIRKAGEEYYVNLHLHRSYGGAKVDDKERSVPIEVDYPQLMNQVIVLQIPDGYAASYIPKGVSQSLPGLGRIAIDYKTEQNKLILTKQIQMDSLLITAEQFAGFNQLISALQASYKESVVLSPK